MNEQRIECESENHSRTVNVTEIEKMCTRGRKWSDTLHIYYGKLIDSEKLFISCILTTRHKEPLYYLCC